MTKTIIDFTPAEKLAMNNARDLMKRCMHDDITKEVFVLAQQNYQYIVDVAVTARSERNSKTSIIKKIFKK